MQPKDGVFIKQKQLAAGYKTYILCLTVIFIIVIYSSS